MDLHFDLMLNTVYSWWPATIGPKDQVSEVDAVLFNIEERYESDVAPLALASGSKLLIQLDWTVYGAVCAALKVCCVVRLNELRHSYVKERFHKLLSSVGAEQLRGQREFDGSFDLDELAAYFKKNNLHF